MRLSTSPERDDVSALETIRAAHDAGVRWFDTAHSYGFGEDDLGHNERLVARALAGRDAFVVTKGGMARPGGQWKPDGRASRIRSDAEASATALGRPIDALLLHVPDPSTAWATSVRALKRVLDDGVARSIGLSNVNLARLDEALALAPISIVQLALSLLDDEPIHSGVLARCLERGIVVMAHTPLGGPKRVSKLLKSPVLGELAARHGVSAGTIAIAGVLAVAPNVVAIPGARRAEVSRSISQAGTLSLSVDELEALRSGFRALRSAPVSRAATEAPKREGEVVMLMGLQGSGKSEQVSAWVAKGYTRLNRDTAGGTLRDLAATVDVRLREGVTRLVLDNTYVTRSTRAQVLEVAARHGVEVRGVWFDTPLHEAQVNVIGRMLEAHGRLLSPEELRRGIENTMLPPMAQLRLLRELELPTAEEGFAALEMLGFVRRPVTGVAARLVALERLDALTADPSLLTFVFGWKPDAPESELAELSARATALGATLSLCVHPAGPPTCWCRPPLPGLLLAFARNAGVDLARSELLGVTPSHEVMGRVVGAQVSLA